LALKSLDPKTKPRIFHGWYIVGTVILVGTFLGGFQSYAFSFFFIPISEDLDLSRTATSGVLTLRAIIMAIFALPVGIFLDKYGSRVLMVFGIIVGGLSTIGMFWVNSLLAFYLAMGVGRTLGVATAAGEVGTTTVAKWFVRRRGRAMAFATMGTPMAGVILPILTVFLISSFGWRAAFAMYGAFLMAVLLLPAFLFMRRMPEDMGLLPDGDHPDDEPIMVNGKQQATADEPVWTMPMAVRTPSLWLLTLSMNFSMLMIGAVMLHIVPYITDQGFSNELGAVTITTMAVGAVSAKFFWGFLSEKYPFRYLMAIGQLLDATALVVFISFPSTAGILIGGAMFGFARTQAIWSAIGYASYYGRHFLGTVRGVVAPFRLISGAGGPILAGVFYDSFGNYNAIFLLLAASSATGAFFAVLARPPVHPSERTSTRDEIQV
jgi:sugar phosphate permease